MVDSLAMFFGAKKRKVKRSPARKVKKSYGTIVVKGRERKLFKGSNGGLYYKTKSGRTYVDAKFVRKHSPRRARASPKRRRPFLAQTSPCSPFLAQTSCSPCVAQTPPCVSHAQNASHQMGLRSRSAITN